MPKSRRVMKSLVHNIKFQEGGKEFLGSENVIGKSMKWKSMGVYLQNSKHSNLNGM